MIEQLVKAAPIGEARDRQLLKDAHSFIYFNSPSGELAAHFFFPPGHDPSTARAPVILFLHGGMWDLSMPTQFVPHCHHFASRGAVTVTIEYRVRNTHDTTPIDALEDCAMALVFLKKNAQVLGIDPERIVLSGAGSGAHLALCCATLPEIGREAGAQFRPAALFLFSPVVDTTRKGVGHANFASEDEAKKHSPATYVPQKGLPPCLVFHGQQDRLIPVEQVARFCKRYSRKRNKCNLMEFVNAGHTFFNYNSHEENYEVTLRAADFFLVDLQILEPDPFVGEF